MSSLHACAINHTIAISHSRLILSAERHGDAGERKTLLQLKQPAPDTMIKRVIDRRNSRNIRHCYDHIAGLEWLGELQSSEV